MQTQKVMGVAWTGLPPPHPRLTGTAGGCVVCFKGLRHRGSMWWGCVLPIQTPGSWRTFQKVTDSRASLLLPAVPVSRRRHFLPRPWMLPQALPPSTWVHPPLRPVTMPPHPGAPAQVTRPLSPKPPSPRQLERRTLQKLVGDCCLSRLEARPQGLQCGRTGPALPFGAPAPTGPERLGAHSAPVPAFIQTPLPQQAHLAFPCEHSSPRSSVGPNTPQVPGTVRGAHLGVPKQAQGAVWVLAPPSRLLSSPVWL